MDHPRFLPVLLLFVGFCPRRLMEGKMTKLLFTVCVLAIAVSGCKQPPEPIEQVRALKTYTITDVADGQLRKFPGIVQATDSSSLSFEVGGKVTEVNVDIGDEVKKGEVIARLDREPYKLDVQAAEAELAKARAEHKNKKQQHARVAELAGKGWASQAHLDAALAGRDTSANQINFAVSKLNLAKRDLRLTVLEAPYDGSIAARFVDPHVEVLQGQKIFDINAAGALRVEFNVPETLIRKIHIGMPVKIRFPTMTDLSMDGRVTFVGSAALTANSFPVKADVFEPGPDLKPGMTSEVNLLMETATGRSGFLVPLAAIAPGDEEKFGFVYKFDPQTSTVKRTQIERAGSTTDNMVAISNGVSAGDVIAVAGVSFLYDGQKVKLMNP